MTFTKEEIEVLNKFGKSSQTEIYTISPQERERILEQGWREIQELIKCNKLEGSGEVEK